MTKAYKERHDYFFSDLQKMPGLNAFRVMELFILFLNVEGLLLKTTNITNDIQLSEYLLNMQELQ